MMMVLLSGGLFVSGWGKGGVWVGVAGASVGIIKLGSSILLNCMPGSCLTLTFAAVSSFWRNEVQ